MTVQKSLMSRVVSAERVDRVTYKNCKKLKQTTDMKKCDWECETFDWEFEHAFELINGRSQYDDY